jgi:hypothetical protein
MKRMQQQNWKIKGEDVGNVVVNVGATAKDRAHVVGR